MKKLTRYIAAIMLLTTALFTFSCSDDDYYDNLLPLEDEIACDTIQIDGMPYLSYHSSKTYIAMSSIWYTSEKMGDIVLYTCPLGQQFYYEPAFSFEVPSSTKPAKDMQMHKKKAFCLYAAPNWTDCYSYKSGTAVVTKTTSSTLTVCFTDLVMMNEAGDTHTFNGTTKLNIKYE